MKVDVRLCGALPRSEWGRSARLTSPRASYLAAINALANVPTGIGSKNEDDSLISTATTSTSSSSQHQLHHNSTTSSCSTSDLMPLLEPPSWAVPACGEARLEPVCEALGKQASVDLTSRSFFRIGRSPASDVQLFHGTCSRRHAMMFHHPNGSCYLVDCGSAHGTFVNGQRVVSQGTASWVVPFKVRRGSLIRFGGPGAPAFVLKSFAVGFSAMVSLDEDDEIDEELSCQPAPDVNKPIHSTRSNWLVQVNTRLNALGQTKSCGGALAETSINVLGDVDANIKKRPFSILLPSRPSSSFTTTAPRCCSLDEEEEDNDEHGANKRARCMSPPPPPFMSLQPPISLVSPETSSTTTTTSALLHSARTCSSTSSTTKRVHFLISTTPFYPTLVSPEDSSDEEEVKSSSSLLPMAAAAVAPSL